MALSAAQKTQVYEILGLPQNGIFVNVISLGPYGPIVDTNTFTAVITLINAQLTALSAEQITRVAILLDRWTAIGSTNPQAITDKAGSTITDYEAERAAIARGLKNIIGVQTPEQTQRIMR